MLSIHNEPYCVNITNIDTFQRIKKVDLTFESRTLCIHPNMRNVFMTAFNDNYIDMGVIQLAFQKKLPEKSQ